MLTIASLKIPPSNFEVIIITEIFNNKDYIVHYHNDKICILLLPNAEEFINSKLEGIYCLLSC